MSRVHAAPLAGVGERGHSADEPTFFCGETPCGDVAVFQRTTGEPIYRGPELARDLLDIYRKEAANEADWFHQSAARYAAELEQAIKQVEAARVYA